VTATPAAARLAVLGSPIAHSKSPALHRAAYGVLGLDWEYDAVEVAEGGLVSFVGGLDSSWRGLSLTMPLKREVLPLLDARSPLVEEVGAANTVLLRDGGREGFNTDVPGIIGAFRDAGVESLESVHVLGGGATAASVLSAVSRLGATRALVSVRDPDRARPLEPLAVELGLELVIRPLGVMDRSLTIPSVVVSTLPGGADAGIAFPDEVRAGSVLFDVAYDPWPSALASIWTGTVISGLSMLLHQAIGQVRIFTTGDPYGDIPGEDDVVAAMRAAVGL
jgi:shikimate dehydrogenase